jgi:hypothetical protein
MSTRESGAAAHVIPIYDDARQNGRAPPPPPATLQLQSPRVHASPAASSRSSGSRCVALIDFLLRIAAFGLAAAIATATRHYQFRARWDESPAQVSVSPRQFFRIIIMLYFFDRSIARD